MKRNGLIRVLNDCGLMTRVGVIGVGSMGQNHARIHSELAELVGVYDVDRALSKKVAARFGIKSCDSIDELLSLVEAVSICTITTTHFDVASKAIKAGRHLLVEKPFTGSSGRAAELCRMADKESVTLGAGFVERYNPVVGVAKEAVLEGRFGKLISFASRRVSSFPARIRDVGVIMDLGIHDVDVLRYITGAEAHSVFALGGLFNNASFEDHANLLVEMEGGIMAFIEVNWLTPMKVRKVSLTCSGGYVQLDYIDQSIEVSSSTTKEFDVADAFRVPLETDVRKISVKKEEPLKLELADFLKASASGKAPMATGRDALNDLKVCEAALASLRSGNKMKITN
jgi:UDP-N-acetylglucosamine 3-dehydrogenase